MPLITARICGVCPAAHHLAAAKRWTPPLGSPRRQPPGYCASCSTWALRTFARALSVRASGPDLVMDWTRTRRFATWSEMVKAVPEIARKALLCAPLAKDQRVGGRTRHTPGVGVAGGVSFTLDGEKRRLLESWTAELLPLVKILPTR